MHTVVSHLIQRVCDDESVLCSCRPLWERSPLFWDLFRALSFRAAACRDCSWGIWCACYWFRLWMGLRVWLATILWEVAVSTGPALISVECICFLRLEVLSSDQTPLASILCSWTARVKSQIKLLPHSETTAKEGVGDRAGWGGLPSRSVFIHPLLL